MIKMEKAQGLLKWWSGDVSHEAHGDYRPAARRAATAALAGDTAAGEKIFKAQCGICHAVAAGENRIGPTLFGVVGRPAQRNDAMCHVWTAPGWQELFSRFAALVGAAMCSAF